MKDLYLLGLFLLAFAGICVLVYDDAGERKAVRLSAMAP